MGIYSLNETGLIMFFAGLVRVSFLMMILPFFGNNVIPSTVKIFVALTFVAGIYPIIQLNTGLIVFESSFDILLLVVKEALVGIVIGFAGKLIFDAMSFGFAYMGMQMGFGFATFYDPNTQASTPVISQFMVVVATLLFIAINAHYLLIKAMIDSFTIVPIGTAIFTKEIVGYVMMLGGNLFWIAIKLAAPVATIIFIVNVGFGIIARAVPQINVLIVSFTVNIMIGLIVLLMTISLLGVNVNEITVDMYQGAMGVMRFLNG